jgi:hypothetical protein
MKLTEESFQLIPRVGSDGIVREHRLCLTGSWEMEAITEEIGKLNSLEIDVRLTLEGERELTAAQVVTLLAERRKIIYARSLILGLITPEGHGE